MIRRTRFLLILATLLLFTVSCSGGVNGDDDAVKLDSLKTPERLEIESKAVFEKTQRLGPMGMAVAELQNKAPNLTDEEKAELEDKRESLRENLQEIESAKIKITDIDVIGAIFDKIRETAARYTEDVNDDSWQESEYFRVFAYYDGDTISLATHGGENLYTVSDGYILSFYVCEDDTLIFSDGAVEPKVLTIQFDYDWFESKLAGCTFTETNDTDEKAGLTPLTAEELIYFNGNEFFNGEYMNIRNQFLSSLYDAPEKIDLFRLFYCGSGLKETLTEAEKTAVVAYNGWDMEPDCACEKISRTNMDAVLTKYLGLTLADTDKIGLNDFTYLKEYDAYYYYHGDTNYRMEITFSGGEREGDIIRLFYNDTYMTGGSKVLTLREKDGGYLFVSNQKVPKS
jgi:hypothetical protein